MTHPFHPLSGKSLMCLARRYNRAGVRLLLRVNDDRVCSVPPRWTDLVEPELEVVLANGRASLLIDDLLELAKLITDMKTIQKRHDSCKANSVACVKQTTPRRRSGPRQ